MRTLFFDTYAFFEIVEGNANYDDYTENVAIITTKLNLMELHYGLLVKYGKETAEKYYKELVKFAIEMDDTNIIEANYLRAALKKKKFSYVDCIGYTMAKARNAKFLTGDRQFADLDNVEYVK